jgi:hypothetical protein
MNRIDCSCRTPEHTGTGLALCRVSVLSSVQAQVTITSLKILIDHPFSSYFRLWIATTNGQVCLGAGSNPSVEYGYGFGSVLRSSFIVSCPNTVSSLPSAARTTLLRPVPR